MLSLDLLRVAVKIPALGQIRHKFGTSLRNRSPGCGIGGLAMIRGSWAAGGLAVCVLSGLCVAPPVTRAQDATWLAAPGSSDFNTGTNWSGGTAPGGTASFGASSTTSLTFSSGVTFIGGLTFNAGAPAYTLTTSGIQGLAITGADIRRYKLGRQFDPHIQQRYGCAIR
jgi:hypothetical protein